MTRKRHHRKHRSTSPPVRRPLVEDPDTVSRERAKELHPPPPPAAAPLRSPHPKVSRGHGRDKWGIQIPAWVEAVGTLLVAAVAVVALLQARSARNESSRATNGVSTVTENLHAFVSDPKGEYLRLLGEVYLDRQLEHAPPEFKAKTLKEVRHQLRQRWAELEPEDSRRALEALRQETLVEGSLENAFAYEVGLALQRVGSSVYTGSLSLDLVLATNGYELVEDWVYCSALVEDRIRRSADPRSVSDLTVPFARRHAEWLASIAIVYMKKKWVSPQTDTFLRFFGGLKHAREREKLIREAEPELMPETVRKRVEELMRE